MSAPCTPMFSSRCAAPLARAAGDTGKRSSNQPSSCAGEASEHVPMCCSACEGGPAQCARRQVVLRRACERRACRVCMRGVLVCLTCVALMGVVRETVAERDGASCAHSSQHPPLSTLPARAFRYASTREYPPHGCQVPATTRLTASPARAFSSNCRLQIFIGLSVT